MDPVYDALERVIEQWCGAAPGSYGLGMPLSQLWAQSNGGAVPYDPDGIDGLLDAIMAENIFAQCDLARALNRQYFVEDGGIQTVGDLYDYLQPCGDTVDAIA